MDFKSLKRKCASCGKNYEKCKGCRIYEILNRKCDFCGGIGNVVPFSITTSRGRRRFYACPRCLRKLT